MTEHAIPRIPESDTERLTPFLFESKIKFKIDSNVDSEVIEKLLPLDMQIKIAKEECLALWKKLSEMPELDTRLSMASFKNQVLESLDIEKRSFGCPLCERFHDTINCPLGVCHLLHRSCLLEKSYKRWHDTFETFEGHGHHDPKAAKAFYNYLLKKFREQELKI